jgi:hypothetical protein
MGAWDSGLSQCRQAPDTWHLTLTAGEPFFWLKNTPTPTPTATPTPIKVIHSKLVQRLLLSFEALCGGNVSTMSHVQAKSACKQLPHSQVCLKPSISQRVIPPLLRDKQAHVTDLIVWAEDVGLGEEFTPPSLPRVTTACSFCSC